MNKIKLKTMLISGVIFAGASSLTGQNQQTTQRKAAQQEVKTPEILAAEAELKWYNPDYRPYIASFAELVRLSDAFVKNKLRLALSNYQTGKSLIIKMRQEVRRVNEEAAEAKHLGEKWYWQTVDRKAREERIINRIKRKAKLKAVTYFTRSILQLDEIHNKRVREGNEFKKLLASVYIEWIVYQYDMGNLPQCIDILERYVALDPKHEREISPHKYLASAYGFKEKILERYKAGTEQELLFYKKKKNEHLLRAAELKYKKDSPEYEQIVELVNRDEIIAVSP